MGTGAQVSESRSRVGVAVGLPSDAHLYGRPHWPAAPPSPARIGPPAGRPGRCAERGHRQARHVRHVSPLVRYSPAGGEPRYPHRSGAPRSSRREHDSNLYARPQPRPRGRPESGRPDVPVVTVPERPDLTAGAVVLNRGALRDNTMAEVRAVLQRFNNPAGPTLHAPRPPVLHRSAAAVLRGSSDITLDGERNAKAQEQRNRARVRAV